MIDSFSLRHFLRLGVEDKVRFIRTALERAYRHRQILGRGGDLVGDVQNAVRHAPIIQIQDDVGYFAKCFSLRVAHRAADHLAAFIHLGDLGASRVCSR